MAVNAGDAFLSIHPELAAGFGRRLSAQVQTPVNRAGQEASHHFGRSFARGLRTASVAIGAGLAVATVAATRGILSTTKAASDLNETVSKGRVVFGSSAKQVERFGATAAKSMGQSRQQALEAAATFGNLFVSMKIGQKPAADMSTKMVALASDLASFNNVKPEEALEALRSGLVGETEPLRKFGVNLNDAALRQEALRLGLVKTTKEVLPPAAKAQASYSLILKQTTTAQGDFARTSQGQANQQRIAKAQWEDLKTTIGQGFLPAQLAVTRALTSKLLPALKIFAADLAPKAGAVVTRLAEGFARSIPTAKELSLGISALGAAFSGEGVTTSPDKFVGKMERVGVVARKIVSVGHELRLALHLAAAGFREGDVTSGGWHGTMEKVGVTARRFVDSFREAAPQLRAAGGGGRLFANSLVIVGPVLEVVARNLHNILPWLPAIVTGFLAFRAVRTVIGPISDLGTAIRNFATPALVIATFAQARAQRALAVAMREQAASSLGAAAAQSQANVASNAGIVASIRARAAAIGQAVAQKAVMVATRAWAAAQWLINVALTANPIGLIVVAIAGLIAGIVLAYKHSETFRRIVDAAFKGALRVISAVWDWVKGHWPLLLVILTGPIGAAVLFIIRNFDKFRTVALTAFRVIVGAFLVLVGAIINGAAKAFGWVPGIGGKLKGAADEFNKFKDRANAALGGIRDQTVDVTAKTRVDPNVLKVFTTAGGRAMFRAKGGIIPGYGGGDIVPAMLEPGEAVVDKQRTRIYAPVLAAMGIPGFAAGGIVPRGVRRFGRDVVPGYTGMRARASKLMVAAAKRALDLLAPFTGLAGMGGRISGSLASWIAAAIGVTGVPASWGPALARRAMFESGGNPRAINLTDINAQLGHPSKGLMQTIDSTFSAYAWDGLRDIWNPIHNLVAAIRYILARYGSIFRIDPPVRGYRHGGLVMDGGGWLVPGWNPPMFNGTGRPEPIGPAGAIDYDRLGRAVAKALRDLPPVVAVSDVRGGIRSQQRREGVPRNQQIR